MTSCSYPVAWTGELTTHVTADSETVFTLLTEIELWPAVFRHVRSARVLRRRGNQRLVAVRTVWRGIPIGWRALQTIDAPGRRMTLRHVGPLTRGSTTVWTVRPAIDVRDGVALSMEQRVVVRVPLIGGWLGRRIVGLVTHELSQSMLGRLKQIAEGGSLAGRD